MGDRTYTCMRCGIRRLAEREFGPMPKRCPDCDPRRCRTTSKRPAFYPECQRCGGPLPEGRADRKWCSRSCQARANRRAPGEVMENPYACTSCGVSLRGYKSDARVCREPRCRGWASRNPGVLHPSTKQRTCGYCGRPIDHLNGRGKWCNRACKAAGTRRADLVGHNARMRAWQRTEYAKAKAAAWRRANPARRQNYWNTRRARERGNPGSVGVTARDWQRLVARYRERCAYCGARAVPVHMDHVLPLARGGRHAIGNVLPTCRDCNFSKHAMLLVVWRYRVQPRLERLMGELDIEKVGDDKFVPPRDGESVGYWGYTPDDTDDFEYSVAGVTKDLPGPSGTAKVSDPPSKEAAARVKANTAAVKGDAK